MGPSACARWVMAPAMRHLTLGFSTFIALAALACGSGPAPATVPVIRVQTPGGPGSGPLLDVLTARGLAPALASAESAMLVPEDRSAWAHVGRLFAADCAEHALFSERERGREPAVESWAAVVAARQFAKGEIGDGDRRAAQSAVNQLTNDGVTAPGAPMAAAWAAWYSISDDNDARTMIEIMGGTPTGFVAGAAQADAEHAGAAGVGMARERAWQTERLRMYLTEVEVPAVPASDSAK